jgi:Amt family ammonium transporter
MLFALFQAKFAIITPALTGAFAERIRFGLTYFYLWSFYTIIYTPLIHDLASDGIFFKMGY